MPTSLVTGGAGFIGSHVAKHCINAGHTVVVLDDLTGGFKDQVPEGAIFVEGTITDGALVARLFDQYKFDYVYHLAAYAAEGLSHFIRKFNYMNNLIGSVLLINEAVKHEVKCFVFTSSIAVYGTLPAPMTEAMQPRPEDPYGVAKYAVEMDLHAAHEMFGLNSVIFRPHNVYGEHQNLGDKYRNVIGIFMNQIMNDQPLTVFGDGNQTRAFSYIDDVAPQIASSVSNPKAQNQIINIGADTPYSVNQLIEVVGKAFNVKPKVSYLPPRLETVHAYCSHDRAREIFGNTPVVTLEEGVERMAEWAKRAGSRQSSVFEEIEVEKNMPPSWKR